MKYWNYLIIWWQYPLFALGWLLFWTLSPVWAIYYATGGADAAFVMLNVQALFYNPWTS